MAGASWPPTSGTPQGVGCGLLSHFHIRPRLAVRMVLATQQRTGYRDEAIRPVITALRGLDYVAALRLADTARMVNERDSPDIHASIGLQFEQAHATYQASLQRPAQTRQWAVGALLASIQIINPIKVLATGNQIAILTNDARI